MLCEELETMEDLVAYHMHITIRKIAGSLLGRDDTALRRAMQRNTPLRGMLLKHSDAGEGSDRVLTAIRNRRVLPLDYRSEDVLTCAGEYIHDAADLVFTKLYDLVMEDIRSEEEEG